MESVWDYPRPPRLERSEQSARVELGGVVVAESERPLRVLETSQAPGIYFPPDDVDFALLVSTGRRTMCEWKGQAHYYDVRVGERVAMGAAWAYANPVPAYAELAGHVAFYPQRMDTCVLGGEVVDANQGDFYGGWITSHIEGPFKGGPGSLGW